MYEGLELQVGNDSDYEEYKERFGTLRALALTRRSALDQFLNRKAEEKRDKFLDGYLGCDTVIIGGGLHASVYAANVGILTPVVIERRPRLGGAFAACSKPAFRLNSRNRPDDGERRPGGDGSLNYIPGGNLQVADLSVDEYPTQDNFALAIKANLIEQAVPLPATEIREIRRRENIYAIGVVANGVPNSITTLRIIVATGIGESTKLTMDVGSDRSFNKVYTFERWLRRLSVTRFPWRNVKRLAVIGANDSGKVVIEHALGQGPSAPGSANLDFVRQIDWYGQTSQYQETYEECERSRYVGIGRYMPRIRDDEHFVRVFPIDARATGISTNEKGPRIRYIAGGYRTSAPYDMVIVCTGFRSSIDDLFKPLIPRYVPLTEPVFVEGEMVARKYTGLNVYKVGPAADIPVADGENLGGVPENSAAAFRYVEKTAKLARSLRGT